MSNNNRNPNAVARAIQERLAQAQQQSSESTSANDNANATLRVTKDGRLVPPGEPAPADAGAVTSIPSATFHEGV